VKPIDLQGVIGRISQARSLLVNMMSKWSSSGTGSGMALDPNDSAYKSAEEVYQFKDGDDRNNFLSFAGNKSFVPFWRDYAYKNQLLQSATEKLGSQVSGDGSSAPSASTRKSRGGQGGKSELSIFQEHSLRKMDLLSFASALQQLGQEINQLQAKETELETKIDDQSLNLYNKLEDIYGTASTDDIENPVVQKADTYPVILIKRSLINSKRRKTQVVLDLDEKKSKYKQFEKQRDELLSDIGSTKRKADSVLPRSNRSAISDLTTEDYDSDMDAESDLELI